MGFALQIAATDKAVVVAKNAPVIINAVIFMSPSVLRIDYAYAGESSFTRRTPVATESVITIVANTAIFVPSVVCLSWLYYITPFSKKKAGKPLRNY